MVYALIDHRNDPIKCSKLFSETTRQRLVVPLEFWTFYDVISMVYKSVGPWKIMVDLLNSSLPTFQYKGNWRKRFKNIENAVYLLYVSYILREKRAEITSVVLLFQEYQCYDNETCIILDAVRTSDIRYWFINHKWALSLIGYLGLDMIELVSKISLYLVWMLWV